MTDRPTIFSAPMVRALLDGRKTQTRRILKPQPEFFDVPIEAGRGVGRRGRPNELWPFRCMGHPDERDWQRWAKRAVGPCAPGDRLWVREAWCRDAEAEGKALYRADGEHVVLDDGDGFTATNRDGSERSPWRPSIHMPRWASRLTLGVTQVRVERLHDISEADATAEGARPAPGGWWSHAEGQAGVTAKASFGVLWNSINGADAWAANPWVVATTFSVHRANIDALDIGAAA